MKGKGIDKIKRKLKNNRLLIRKIEVSSCPSPEEFREQSPKD